MLGNAFRLLSPPGSLMLATSLISLALLILAGLMLDANRRGRGERIESDDDHTRRFLSSRRRRRTTANLSIVVVGVLFALWPITPREPLWVASYVAAMSLLALVIFTLGVCDAWSSGKYYREVSRRRLAEQTARLREVIEERRVSEAKGARP